MERRMGPHESVAPVPVEVHLVPSGGADIGWSGAGLQLVDNVVADLARRDDDPRPAVRRPDDAPVRGLAAAARIEDGPIEDDEGALPLLRRLTRIEAATVWR
jgi:hypothetical protein